MVRASAAGDRRPHHGLDRRPADHQCRDRRAGPRSSLRRDPNSLRAVRFCDSTTRLPEGLRKNRVFGLYVSARATSSRSGSSREYWLFQIVVGLGAVGHAAGGRVVLESLAGLVGDQAQQHLLDHGAGVVEVAVGLAAGAVLRRYGSCPCRRRSSPSERCQGEGAEPRRGFVRPSGWTRHWYSEGPERPGSRPP